MKRQVRHAARQFERLVDWWCRVTFGRVRRYSEGGEMPPLRDGWARLAAFRTHRRYEYAGIIHPGGAITDPDEAEALGATVEARRMRAERAADPEGYERRAALYQDLHERFETGRRRP